MNSSKDMSKDQKQEDEEFYLKPFNEYDNTLFDFTQDLEDPYCNDHKAFYRTKEDDEPNVRESKKSERNKKKASNQIGSSRKTMTFEESTPKGFDRKPTFPDIPQKISRSSKSTYDGTQQQQKMYEEKTGEITPRAPTQEERKAEGEIERAEMEKIKEEAEELLKNQPSKDRKINFAEHLEELKNRTETKLPYTLTQCEDAMYLDRNQIVTLEYHYYQKDCAYVQLSRTKDKFVNIENKLVLKNEADQEVNNKLGTQNYLKEEDQEQNLASQFERKNMCNLQDDGFDLTDQMKNHPDTQEFMKIKGRNIALEHAQKHDIHQENHQKTQYKVSAPYKKQKTQTKRTTKHIRTQEERRDTNLLCPVIAVYKVTNEGKMQRINEVDAKMGGYFNSTHHGCMELTRSLDRKLISLCNFDSTNYRGHFFNVKAWYVKKLKPYDVHQKLNRSLNKYYQENLVSFDHLESINFIGRNKYIQMIYVEKRERQFKEVQNYENDINQKVTKSNLKKHVECPSYIRRSDPRKARKYVFFEVSTGDLMFSYGGVHQPLETEKEITQHDDDINQKNQKKVTENICLYELGLILEEKVSVKKGFQTKLNFIVTGDFLSQELKDKNMIFKWGLCQVALDLGSLIKNFDTPEKREEEINSQLRQIPQHYTEDNKEWKDKLTLLSQKPTRAQTTNFKSVSEESEFLAAQEKSKTEDRYLSQKIISKKKTILFEKNLEKSLKKTLEETESQIKTVIATETDYIYFLYDPHNILNQHFDWEINISVVANKHRDQFAIISSPDQNGFNSNATYYVNGKGFVEKDKDKEPYYVKIANDYYIDHGRNSHVKDELFYNTYSNSLYESSQKTICLRLLDNSANKKVTEFNIPVEDTISEFDQWLQMKKENMSSTQITDIFQIISVNRGDQYAHLQTRIPTSYIGNEVVSYDIVRRRTDAFCVQSQMHPFLAYNLGMKRILFTNIDQTGQEKKKSFILHMKEDEQFVGFAEFNNYHEIGFYPHNLRIECCSPFLYMTRREKEDDPGRYTNHINLILLDPFCKCLEAVQFTSSTTFDNDIFKNSDMIIKTIVQNNRASRMDDKFNVYLWSQVPDKLIRSKMLTQAKDGVAVEDSDAFEEITDDKKMSQHSIAIQQDINIIQDEKSFIYYIVRQNGECKIMEGNPKDPYIQHHTCIFSIKSSNILSFGYEQGSFYIMDEEHTTRKLSRNDTQRMLSLENEMKLKEIQRLDYTPQKFEDSIVREFYAIYRSKIFYFYDIDGEPFPQGILEAEDLLPKSVRKECEHYTVSKADQNEIEFQKGPFKFAHSNRFYLVYRSSHFNSFIKCHILPNQTQRKLINDFQNYVDISTFLNNEQILIKIRRRFMIFSKDGNFINEVSFSKDTMNQMSTVKKNGTDETDSDQRIMTLSALKEKQQKRKLTNNHTTKTSTRQREEEKLLDFKGFPYTIVDEEHADEINDYNRMVLVQFSQNIKYFLFYDVIDQKMILYELVMPQESESFFSFAENSKIEQDMNYSFKANYEIDVHHSKLFNKIYQESTTDLMNHFLNNENQVQVDNEGRVKMFYVLAHNHHATGTHGAQHFDVEVEDKGEESETLQECNVIGSIFQQRMEIRKSGNLKPQSKSICYNFNEKMNFPIIQARRARQKLIENQKKDLNMKINNIRINQSRLPKNLHDYTVYDKFITDLKTLEKTEFCNFNCNIYHQNLLVLSCGNYLMYGFLEKAPSSLQSGQKAKELISNQRQSGLEQIHYRLQKPKRKNLDSCVKELSHSSLMKDSDKLQSIACDFSKSISILKILETSQNNCLQIVAKDLDLKLLFVLTWDFEKNVEISDYQIKDHQFNASSVGNHIIKGLNNKMNYLMNQHHFIDLEHNIPIKQKNVDQGLDSMVRYWNQLRNIDAFTNQKKSNYANDQILGIEKANCLYYNHSRIDVVLWKDIQQNGETKEIIEQSVQLMDFNVVFNSYSLFHYFADKPEIIEFIKNLLAESKMHRKLTIQEESLPLQILNQDPGLKSAVFRSLDMQSPKSFEIMIDMLKDFPEICVSKLILKSLYYIISHPNDSVINFFDQIIYKPPQMETSHMIYYDEDSYGDDIVFSSHTSIVTKKLIDLKLSEKFGESYVAIEDEIKQAREGSKAGKTGEELLEMRLHRSFDENSSNDDGESKPPVRVSIEALDLDWLFVNNNGKRLINLLVAENANINVLGQKSVKVFIDLLWQEYQHQIIIKILIPYLIYMICMGILTGNTVDEWNENKEQRLLHPTDTDIINLDFWITLRAIIYTVISLVIMMIFAALEVADMWKGETPSDYFNSPWNCLDMLSISMNYVFLVMFITNLILKESYFGHNLILDIGSWCMFFMWIKVFYWFRLFTTYAKYIKLIIQTITDMRYFFAMVLIIMLSFGNFMFVANNTLEESPGASYIQREYLPKKNFNFVNSVLSVYMFGALGQFSQQTYIAGYEKYSASAMFILGTFMVSVVFMNMLIAIMSDTFADVESNKEINTLKEQIAMISDYEWLVDLQTSFKDQKYVIRVAPFSGHMKDKDLVLDAINDFQNYLGKQIDATNLEVIKRIDYVEANNKFQLNHQLDNILMMSKKLNELESFSKKTDGANSDEKNGAQDQDGEKLSARVREMRADAADANQKAEFGKVIKKKYKDKSDTSDERIHEITMDMMHRIDQDHSGEIDYQEFYEFFANNDDFIVSNDNIRAMFLEFDKGDKDREVTINAEELARAIKSALTLATLEPEDDSSHKEDGPESQGESNGSYSKESVDEQDEDDDGKSQEYGSDTDQ